MTPADLLPGTAKTTDDLRLNNADEVACPNLGEHFERRCEDCDAKSLGRMNLGDVEYRYQTGRVSQAQFEAYCYCWALLSTSHSESEWRVTPTDPTVRRIARKILRLRGFEVPAELLDRAVAR